MQQRLHREELKLARLKNKQDSVKQAEDGLRRRLGNLLFLLDWQDETPKTLAERFKCTAVLLDQDGQNEQYRVSGTQAFEKKSEERKSAQSGIPAKTLEQRLELDELMISFGGLMKAHEFEHLERATLFGALVQHDKTLVATL